MDEPDVNGRRNVVVTWAGPYPPGQPQYPAIFARRLVFDPSLPQPIRDPNPSEGEGARSDFLVNSDRDPNGNPTCGGPLDFASAYPTVALSSDPNQRGRFIVAWNSDARCGTFNRNEIHGQFFESDGRPLGCEFRLHAATDQVGDRMMAASARHTLAYHANVAVAYTRNASPDPEVWLSIVPAGTAEALDAALSCCKGDVDHDGDVDGDDIDPFTYLIQAVNHPQTYSVVELCPADMNNDNLLNLYDVDCFVWTVLFPPPEGICLTDAGCSVPAAPPFYDCNGNGIEDALDIANCQGDPACADCNQNRMPDGCEFDLWMLTAGDCNFNGVPDECDIASETSPDCNTNWIPDECEPDCNQSGRPEDCDIKLGPPNGSLDCNDNGVPDECDIANCPENNPDCDDCNQNGVPDSCDIASGHSPDRNHDGIPDECALEDGPMMLGPTLECAPPPADLDAALAELHAWCAAQCWGPGCGTTGSEQYKRYVDKQCELGLIGTGP
jgi:hypothetical protein